MIFHSDHSATRVTFKKFILRRMITGIVLLLPFHGCDKNKTDVNQPQDTTSIAGTYGSGWIVFITDSAGGYFGASGDYKPSDQFANDTMSEGAGGFLCDTVFNNKKINAMLAGYHHVMSNDGILSERLMIIQLHDSLGILHTTTYPFMKNNQTTQGQGAYVYFFHTDSVHSYELFTAKNGSLTISSFEPLKRHVHGTFNGTVAGFPPDTISQVTIINGTFDLYLTDKYFNY